MKLRPDRSSDPGREAGPAARAPGAAVRTVLRFAAPAFAGLAAAFAGGLPGCGSESSKPDPSTGRPAVLVVNSLGETISTIDLENGAVANDVVTLGSAASNVYPNDIEISNDGARGYVTNSGQNTIQILDLVALSSLGSIPLGAAQSPYASALFGATTLYVTNLVAGQVAEVDLVTRTVLRRAPAGPGPEGILLVGEKLYVTNTNFDAEDFSYGPGTVSVIDRATMTEVDRIPVGINPQELLLHAGEIHVMCTGDYVDRDGWIYVLSPATGTAVDSIRIGGYPSEMAIVGPDKAYVTEGGVGVLYSYRPSTREVLRGESNPIPVTAGGLFSVAYDAVDGRAYAAEFGADRVWVMDAAADTVITSKLVGDGPVRVRVRRPPSSLSD